MNTATFEKLQEICRVFRLPDTLSGAEEIRQGIINQTYKVTVRREDGSEKPYMIQKINTRVFVNPVQVMENIDRVTEHLRQKMPGKTSLHFHHTEDRKNYVEDEDGFWRLFNFIPSKTYDECKDLEVIRNAGRAFGEFQQLLSDFEVESLNETISHFHDTQRRYEQLDDAARLDVRGRLQEVVPELRWLNSARKKACTLSDMRRAGTLPLRVTHNDTKINNVLFAPEGPEAIVVIDLDTVMPGLVGHDFGDAIRFAGNTRPEDWKNTADVGVNLLVFQEFAKGFLSETAGTLTQNEIDTLALSCFVMTTECAVRFLEDYLSGDTYFKIAYPGQNLVRARCQIALAQDMERHMEQMDAIIRRCVEEYR